MLVIIVDCNPPAIIHLEKEGFRTPQLFIACAVFLSLSALFCLHLSFSFKHQAGTVTFLLNGVIMLLYHSLKGLASKQMHLDEEVLK